jgi:hypothetical protein
MGATNRIRRRCSVSRHDRPDERPDSPLHGLTERLVAIGVVVLVLAIGTALLVAALLSRLTP